MVQLNQEKSVTYLGRTNTTRNPTVFGILRQVDRRSHIAIVGKTGTGKSALLQGIVCRGILRQDVRQCPANEPTRRFDPRGIEVCSLSRVVRNVVVFDTADLSLRYRFNPFGGIAPEQRALAAADALSKCFKKIASDRCRMPRLLNAFYETSSSLLPERGRLSALLQTFLAPARRSHVPEPRWSRIL